MRKVIMKEELYQKMQEAIHLLCDTVKTTLGPKGRNVIIDHSLFTPFITNDGATIARNIESDDAIINTILEIAKEASLKTDENVGDGTTTTLVLLESIFDLSCELIQKGMNPMLLKKNLEQSLGKVLELLEKEKRKTTEKEYEDIAKIAANDEEMGLFIYEVYQKIKTKNGIQIEEVNENKLEVTYQKGYCFPIELASPLFLNEQEKRVFHKPIFVFIEELADCLENYSLYVNDAMKNKRDLLFIANSYTDSFKEECLYFNKEGTLNCALLKINEFGMKQKIINQDIAFLTNRKENIGTCEHCILTNENALISFTSSKKTLDYVATIQKELENIKEEFDQEFYSKRMAMFLNGLAKIKIGAPTKTESHEKKMRLVDALCALESASQGTIVGGGITFLKLASALPILQETDCVLKETLEIPFKQILMNAGIDVEEIQTRIEKEHYQLVYNVSNEKFEEIGNTKVFDSYVVMKQAIVNACSIAEMLLSTTSLVLNEHENNFNKTNEFTEL